MKNHLMCLSMAALALAALSCGKSSGPIEITETREAPAPHDVTAAHAAGGVHSDAPRREYKWTVPEGWTEVEKTAMRIANFRIGEDQQTECYVTILKGTGGGTMMNINRWRGQMGAENAPLTAEAVEQLPKISMFGKEAPLAEATGAYQGMMGETKTGYMLMGTICELGEESVFVKMIGPESVVRAQRDKFIAFCGSLAPASVPAGS